MTVLRGVAVVAVSAVLVLVATGALEVARAESGLVGRLITLETSGFRAYYLLVIVPRVLAESQFMGMGAGAFASRPHVEAYPEQYSQWGFPGQWTLEYSYDSEWAVLLGQYGLAGPVLLYGALLGLGWIAREVARDPSVPRWDRALASAAVCFAVAFPLLGSIGAEVGSRTSGYLVWVVMGAVMSAAGKRRGAPTEVSDTRQSGP